MHVGISVISFYPEHRSAHLENRLFIESINSDSDLNITNTFLSTLEHKNTGVLKLCFCVGDAVNGPTDGASSLLKQTADNTDLPGVAALNNGGASHTKQEAHLQPQQRTSIHSGNGSSRCLGQCDSPTLDSEATPDGSKQSDRETWSMFERINLEPHGGSGIVERVTGSTRKYLMPSKLSNALQSSEPFRVAIQYQMLSKTNVAIALLLSAPAHHLYVYFCSGSCFKTLMENVIVRM